MLTATEIEKYADALDNEYATEIKPILIMAQDSIDKVMSIVNSSEYRNAAIRCGFDNFTFSSIDDEIKLILTGFGYHEEPYGEHNITHYNVAHTVIEFIGYSLTCPCYKNGKLSSVFHIADTYRNNDINKIEAITNLKKRFNLIKKHFNSFFIDNNGEMFRRFASMIDDNFNRVMNADKMKDDELKSLFSNENTDTGFSISITIKRK